MTTPEKVDKMRRASPTINPRTGKIWRLADAEIAPKVEAFQKAIDRPEKALRLYDGAGSARRLRTAGNRSGTS